VFYRRGMTNTYGAWVLAMVAGAFGLVVAVILDPAIWPVALVYAALLALGAWRVQQVRHRRGR
jgi:hypothetical protein